MLLKIGSVLVRNSEDRYESASVNAQIPFSLDVNYVYDLPLFAKHDTCSQQKLKCKIDHCMNCKGSFSEKKNGIMCNACNQ